MKKLLFLLTSCCILSGCAITYNHIPPVSEFYGIDFRPYIEKGFLITPEFYLGEKDIIADVTYVLSPEANRVDLNPNDAVPPVWISQPVNIYQAMDSVYNFCIDRGANGLVNFRLDQHPITTPPPATTINRITITGYAIKRK